jgi:two-component system chemotaxis response regulator CheB
LARAAVSPGVDVVAIGASTGGPAAIREILSGLPGNFSAPVAIVQHITEGFTKGLADWWSRTSPMPVGMASDGASLVPGRVVVAPDGFHMEIDAKGKIKLGTGPPENGLRPSVSRFFRSVARVFGKRAVGVLLTGMGRDGANELRAMKEEGAVTIAQDRKTSVVHGMPGEAIRIGGATLVLPLEKIAEELVRIAGCRPQPAAKPIFP